MYPQVVLHPHKEKAIERQHPWIFSGAIKSTSRNIEDGEIVSVVNYKNEVLGVGHFQNGSISIRILSFSDVSIDQSFFNQRIKNAFELRQKLNLTHNTETNIYRLVHAEGDGLPGLVIDVFDNHAVVQCHSIGMHKANELIVNALKNCFNDTLKSVYDKSAETLPKEYGQNIQNSYLYKREDINESIVIAKEYGNSFEIDFVNGQKTGFFIDQRENRKLLAEFSKDKKVLNTFCYSGGFSVYALNSGASVVHSLDSSKKAIELVENNLKLNANYKGEHKSIVADAVPFMKELPEVYDIIVLDPPAFAKHKSAKHNAIQAYKRLNQRAIEQIKSGGIIFTFSCSQLITKDMFFSTVMAAAIETKRNVRVLHQLHQPADHPVNIYHPESEYLKGLVIQVD